MNRKKTVIMICIMIITVLLLIAADHIMTAVRENSREASLTTKESNKADEIINTFAKENGLADEDYPERKK